MSTKQRFVVLGGTAFVLLALIWLGVRNYGGNVSALLHMDVPFGDLHGVPEGIVLYQDAAYDGMLYYQIARDIPALFSGGTPSLDSPYRFQRILLPLFAYGVTFGNEHALPHALLLINLAAAIGTLALMLSMAHGRTLHAMTAVANPAVLVGILFSLTEPVSLFFVVLFLFAWERNGRRLDVLSIAALLFSLLARETTVFLIGLLFLWYLWRKEWKEALLAVIPVLLFTLWQYFLAYRLGSVPFQANGNIVDLPFGGVAALLLWLTQGVNAYRLSSVALLVFVLPLFFLLLREWQEKRTRIGVLGFLLSGLVATMLTMDAHMWGVITSIGRVVTPVYPVYALYAAERDTSSLRILSVILIVISIVAALGIASVRHPFIIS